MAGPSDAGLGTMDGVVTPVFPAPPVGASPSAKAGQASRMAAETVRAIEVRVIGGPCGCHPSATRGS
jgi:hypothetical protein